ncbi:HalX domain-containing protein [Halosimplex aquaticum]|uniref:HalX domain-containing protein n=1 Tax=Halosimplex aquaticum TaxID=3026162 RepID=A0ABD5Y0V6_9EURY|nr:HalX domain-containing protein [Halosimplex aquaticum]
MISPKSNSEDVTVLVVDDERDIADLYSTWLDEEYDVRTAYGAEGALDRADGAVDVVFLDRQMPEMNGDEVLEVLRERELDCRVVMVTAVDPDFDIVDMPFDDYLTKPVMLEDLYGAVDRMLTRENYDERMQEFFSLASKKATLEAEKEHAELQDNEEYARLEAEVEELRREADQSVAEFSDAEDFETLFQEFPGDA